MSCWSTFLKIFAIVVLQIMDSIPRIITLYSILRGDAMLKHTRINFELFINIDMVMFIEHRGIRGDVPF